MTKHTHGGAGRGQGNKAGSKRVAETRKTYTFRMLPSIVEPFKQRNANMQGRIGRVLEDMMLAALTTNEQILQDLKERGVPDDFLDNDTASLVRERIERHNNMYEDAIDYVVAYANRTVNRSERGLIPGKEGGNNA